MVGSRLAAGLSGLRNRNARVTNKTQLRVVKGSIEADPILLDEEDDEKNRILASQGVDEEDANEHHLQAALLASSQRALSASHFKSYNSNDDTNAYIPTPDAAGLVSQYDNLYPAGQHKDSATHLRFSDSIDESCVDGLSGGFTYFLDDRDAEWLERNNGTARGEGTSASGGINGAQVLNGINGACNDLRGMSRTSHSRGMKGKGKEPELRPQNVTHQLHVLINEDQFELVMGLFEKWTDESVSPYLHLAYDPEQFPGYADYERFFSMPLVPSTFAKFTLPPNLPSPEIMNHIAKVIYPWWRERRIEREGHRIVPQLSVLVLEAQEKEDKTDGSPYICFRKRDVKPMRKTRTNNVTHTEKLTRLRYELQTSLELAKMVLQRETLKKDSVTTAELVWRCRESFAESMVQLNCSTPGAVPLGDESLLFDKEHKARKRLEETASRRSTLAKHRSQTHAELFNSLDPHSPLALNGDTSHLFESRQRDPSERVAVIQREVDRELTKTRKDDVYWEDVIDMPFQSPSEPTGERFRKPVLSALSDSTRSSSASSFAHTPDAQRSSSRAWCMGRSARLRFGRGGRLHLDRRLHISQPHRILQREWAGHPSRKDDHLAAREDVERWAQRSWRPRHEVNGEVRLRRRERQLGEQYWAHPSIYEIKEDRDITDQASAQPQRDLTIGSDQDWRGIHCSAGDRDMTAVGGSGGGDLALFMDGDVSGRGYGSTTQPEDHNCVYDLYGADGRSMETIESAWRVEERWRYDCDGAQQAQDSDDHFLLDDFQPRFTRTIITLLDAQDQSIIATDPQLLAPPPLKQNRYLDHQLRLQHPGLLQPSVSGSTHAAMPKTHSFRQMSLPSHSVSSSTLLQKGLEAHTSPSLSPTQNFAPVANGQGNPATHSLPSPKPLNGVNALEFAPNGVRLPSHTSPATVRVNTPARMNPPLSVPVLQGGMTPSTSLSVAPSTADAASHGTSQPCSASYSTLRTTLDRMLTSQHDTQQRARVFQKPIINGPVSNGGNLVNGDAASITHSLAINNVHLKLPTQRAAQLRTRVNGETHNNTSTASQGLDHYPYTQQLACLPANSLHQS